MPGYMIAMGGCYICGLFFEFNVDLVPSVPDSQGILQPICEECIKELNIERKKMGNPPFEILPGAYEPGEVG
jgi:hypothetical protein